MVMSGHHLYFCGIFHQIEMKSHLKPCIKRHPIKQAYTKRLSDIKNADGRQVFIKYGSYMNSGIKHDFPFINICKVPREVLKPSVKPEAGFPQALEIMENLEHHKQKFHAWKNHGI